MTKCVTYSTDVKSFYVDEVFRFFSFISGIRFIKKDTGAEIQYGTNSDSAKLFIRHNAGDVLWKELIENRNYSGSGSVIGFDIINAVAKFISDEVNTGNPESCFDRHGRLQFKKSFQAKNGIGEIPVVNLYTNFFLESVKKHLGISPEPLYPNGKKCAVCLSHDVDSPVPMQFFREFGYNPAWNFRERSFHFSRKVYKHIKKIFIRPSFSIIPFSEIIREEKSFGFNSTFFFVSENGYSDWGSVYDVFYDILWDEFRVVFRSILENGFYIGLHASYNSFSSHERLLHEKEKLEDIAGTKVSGLRHHFWHMSDYINDTLFLHEKAGFSYDSTVGFNDHPGFRRNTAYPFYPFDIKKEFSVRTLQIPVFCMDGNLFYRNLSFGTSMELLKKYIDILKSVNGTAAVDWHAETSFSQKGRFDVWSKTYRALLTLLAEDSDVWVTSPDKLYAYMKKREGLVLG